MSGRELLAELEACGVMFELRPFYRNNGRTVDAETPLVELDIHEWDAEVAPTWPILSSSAPAATVVNTASEKWEADPVFRSLIELAWLDRQERELTRGIE